MLIAASGCMTPREQAAACVEAVASFSQDPEGLGRVTWTILQDQPPQYAPEKHVALIERFCGSGPDGPEVPNIDSLEILWLHGSDDSYAMCGLDLDSETTALLVTFSSADFDSGPSGFSLPGPSCGGPRNGIPTRDEVKSKLNW